MLKQIPFYGSLLRRDLGKGRISSHAHVLLYGAIEVHSLGPKGCIASNDTLAKEVGFGKERVANILSEMSQAGWVTVVLTKDNQRKSIIPNGEIAFTPVTANNSVNPPSLYSEPPLHSTVNIDNNLDNSTTYSKAKALNPTEPTSSFGASPEGALAPEGTQPYSSVVEKSTPLALYYRVIKKYSLPVTNNNHVKKWAKDLENTLNPDIAELYLNRLLERDLVAEKKTQEFVPTLNTAFDIYQKSQKIIQYLKRTKDLSSTTEDKEADLIRRSEEELGRGGYGR